MNNKYFKNITSSSADFYLYGAIVDEKVADWWTGEVSKTEVDPIEFKDELDNLNGIKDLNIYINSPGGSVFASSTMVSILNRAKEKGIKVHAFIDGLCASAASYLCMVADDINIYDNSVLMIHKPITFSFGNANDLQKDIDTLNTIQEGVMMPMYMKKAKISEEEIKNMVDNETWLSADEIKDTFEVNVLEDNKEIAACTDKKLFMNYKNVPKSLKFELNESNKINNTHELQKDEPKQQKVVKDIDYSKYENRINKLKGAN